MSLTYNEDAAWVTNTGSWRVERWCWWPVWQWAMFLYFRSIKWILSKRHNCVDNNPHGDCTNCTSQNRAESTTYWHHTHPVPQRQTFCLSETKSKRSRQKRWLKSCAGYKETTTPLPRQERQAYWTSFLGIYRPIPYRTQELGESSAWTPIHPWRRAQRACCMWTTKSENTRGVEHFCTPWRL